MTSWLTVTFIFATWFLCSVSVAARLAVEDTRANVPESQRRGTSIFPGIPLVPLVFCGLAFALDAHVSPWGTRIVVLAHAGFFLVLSVSIARNAWRLRQLAKQRLRQPD